VEAQRRGRHKKRLRATALQQLYLIWEEQPIQGPLHPYLAIWFLCLKYGNGISGQPCLYNCTNPADMDAELQLAFDVFGESRTEWEKNQDVRKQQMEVLRRKYREQFGAEMPEPPT
jgi:hypothetical protein